MFLKRKGRKLKWKAPKRRVVVLVLIAAAIVGTAAWRGMYSSREMKITLPLAYEETCTVASDLEHEIVRIDGAIYEALYKEGVSEKDILFLAVKPRHEGGHEWEFTELMVRLKQEHPNHQYNKILTRVLSALDPSVHMREEKVSDAEFVCHLFTRSLYTHKIRLTTEEPQKPSPEIDLPRIAIVVDDLGYDLEIAKSLIHLDLPLTFSVLPLALHSKSIVREVNASGRELMLHLPMEPRGYPHVNPGPGALLKAMQEERIRVMVGDHLRNMPGVRGVNNHMGSRFTELEGKMAVVMNELKKRQLFYLDSITSGKSVSLRLAKAMGVPATGRTVFLDNDLSPKYIRSQIERLLGMARHRGHAIGICHPHKETLNCLQDSLPRLKGNARIVFASELASVP